MVRSVGRRAIALAGACLVAAGALVGWATAPAGADSPVAQGWWASAPIGPDVPSDGLLVQGGIGGPTAYAALAYEFDASSASELTVTVLSGSATTPGATLLLCPLDDPNFDAKQGGTMEEAPDYNAEGCLDGVVASSSGEFRFDVSSLVDDGALAVALLAASPGDRIVLAAPGADSLLLDGGSDTAGASPAEDPVAVDPSFDSSFDSSSSLDVPSVDLDAPATASPSTSAPRRSRQVALSAGSSERLPRVMFLYSAIAVAALAVGGSGFLMRRMGVSWTG